MRCATQTGSKSILMAVCSGDVVELARKVGSYVMNVWGL